MNKSRKFLYRLLLGALAFVVLLGACGPQYDIGLDAVTQTGRWMSILQPVQDELPQLTIIDVHTGTTQLTITDAYIYQQPITIYSPSSNYLLYRGSEIWRLVEISSGNILDLAPTTMKVEFIPDDEILITYNPEEDGQSQAYLQLWLVSPKMPDRTNWTPITDRGRYVFRSKSLSLSDAPFLTQIPMNDLPSQAYCPPLSGITRDARIIVDADGLVSVLLSDTRKSYISRLYNLSAATSSLLNSHEAMIAAMQKSLEEQLKSTDDADKQNKVENAIARSGISGLASPDGRYLLLITATSINTNDTKYSLNLINLETDIRISLSNESDWIPSAVFSPDGTQIIYESNMKGDRAWYLITLDNSNIIRLPLQGIGSLCWH